MPTRGRDEERVTLVLLYAMPGAATTLTVTPSLEEAHVIGSFKYLVITLQLIRLALDSSHSQDPLIGGENKKVSP